LDFSIDDPFVSSVQEEVSFALIDCQDRQMEKKRYASGMKQRSRYQGMGDTIVQLRGQGRSGLIANS
jgi:hypothetical protein